MDISSDQFKTEGIFDGQEDRANYYGRYIETFARAGGAACFPFKFEDNGVPGYGIEGTPALAAVSEQIRGLTPEVPTHEPEIGEIPMSEEPFRGTIAEYLTAHPTQKLWVSPGMALIRSRGSGTSRERTAWLDNPDPTTWEYLREEGGYVAVVRLHPNQ